MKGNIIAGLVAFGFVTIVRKAVAQYPSLIISSLKGSVICALLPSRVNPLLTISHCAVENEEQDTLSQLPTATLKSYAASRNLNVADLTEKADIARVYVFVFLVSYV